MSPTPEGSLPPTHWAALARAAAEARRFRSDGLAGCYGDVALWATADGRVTGQLERAISAAIDAVLALTSVARRQRRDHDPELDAAAAELLERLEREVDDDELDDEAPGR